jgi:hypothetical protein
MSTPGTTTPIDDPLKVRAAVRRFTVIVTELTYRTRKLGLEPFSATAVPAEHLERLAKFFADLAKLKAENDELDAKLAALMPKGESSI